MNKPKHFIQISLVQQILRVRDWYDPVRMIWEENCLLPKNGRSAPGARRPTGVNFFLALGSLEIFWALGAYCKSKSQGQWIFWSSTFARRIMSFYPILTLIPYFCSICYVFFKFIKICDIVCLFSIILAIWSYQLQNVIFAKNWKIKIAKNLGNRQTMTKFFTNSKSINKILKM